MFTVAYATGTPWNDSQWIDPRFQELLLTARSEIDNSKRREMYTEMQSIMSTDGGTIVPMFANYVDAKTSNLTHPETVGNAFSLDGGRIAERWWFA